MTYSIRYIGTQEVLNINCTYSFRLKHTAGTLINSCLLKNGKLSLVIEGAFKVKEDVSGSVRLFLCFSFILINLFLKRR